MTLEIGELFETPLILASVTASPEEHVQLRAAIADQIKRDPKGVAISNRQGWHSDTQMLEWGGPAAHSLVECVVDLADQYTLDITKPERPRFAWVPEMWANVSGYGASNTSHCHPGAYWSAVYYVDDGYGGSSDRSLGGELEVEDPRNPMVLMEGPDLRFRMHDRNPVSDPFILIRPGTGRLLMFPGWLRHAVRPYFGRRERISIAINLTAVPVD